MFKEYYLNITNLNKVSFKSSTEKAEIDENVDDENLDNNSDFISPGHRKYCYCNCKKFLN